MRFTHNISWLRSFLLIFSCLSLIATLSMYGVEFALSKQELDNNSNEIILNQKNTASTLSQIQNIEDKLQHEATTGVGIRFMEFKEQLYGLRLREESLYKISRDLNKKRIMLQDRVNTVANKIVVGVILSSILAGSGFFVGVIAKNQNHTTNSGGSTPECLSEDKIQSRLNLIIEATHKSKQKHNNIAKFNLIIGLALSAFGIFLVYISAASITSLDGVEGFKDIVVYTKLSLGAMIQIVAFFFLNIYRKMTADSIYFDKLTTDIDLIGLAYLAAILSENSNSILDIIKNAKLMLSTSHTPQSAEGIDVFLSKIIDATSKK